MSENKKEIEEILIRLAEFRGYSKDTPSSKALRNNNTMSLEKVKEFLRKELEKDLYKLNLHETVLMSFGITIMKVESGYLYDCWDIEKNEFKQGVFVPFKYNQ